MLEPPGPELRTSFCICASMSMLCKLINFWGRANFLLSNPGNFFFKSTGPFSCGVGVVCCNESDLQGVPRQTCILHFALAGRNMQASFGLKVI